MKILKSLVAMVLTFALAGCVLQSPKAVFSDADGTLALSSLGTNLTIVEVGSGAAPATSLGFQVVGRHYLVHDKGNDAAVTFVALRPSWFGVQVVPTKGPVIYSLAKVEKDNAQFYPLMCKALKADAIASQAITFDGKDCFAKGSFSKETLNSLVGKVSLASHKVSKAP